VPEACALVRPLAEERHIRLKENSARSGRIYIWLYSRDSNSAPQLFSNAPPSKYTREVWAGRGALRAPVRASVVSIRFETRCHGISPQDLPSSLCTSHAWAPLLSSNEGRDSAWGCLNAGHGDGGTLSARKHQGPGTYHHLEMPAATATRGQVTNLPQTTIQWIHIRRAHLLRVVQRDNPSNCAA
jgi:hypothetical protein